MRAAARWALLLLLMTALVAALAAQGLSTRTTGASRTPRPGSPKGQLAGSRPILIWNGRRLESREGSPGRRIALTFDDGPDPTWTPRIAAALRRLHVPATFFVIGSKVARHPGLVRTLYRDGFELGNHTFTHVDLASVPAWERRLQITLTESALAGAVGVGTRLVRPPYSSTPAAVTPQQARTFGDVTSRGYVIVLSDFDGEDWRRPGVKEIVRAATPPRAAGGIVLLHDGGGDRSETLAAVERLVPRLRTRGFRFLTVSQLAGLSRAQVELPARSWERTRGRLLVGTLSAAQWTSWVLALLLAAATVLFVLRIVVLFVFAKRHRRAVGRRAPDPSFAPPVSIVVPAFNEAVGIERAVRSLAESDYPELEVVVVDDGSTDGTAELVQRLGLACLVVLRQPNMGKAAALNHGIATACHDLLVLVDADTIFEPETLARLVQPFRDAEVGAASGNTKVGNRRGLLGRWQHIEYVMGFNLDRRLYDVVQCMPTVPGAIGAFRREALADIGGISGETLAEDTDATIALGRAGWRVVYVEEARAWTEAPSSLGALWRQRYRWCYGTLQSIWKHKAAFWRKGEERIGRRALPYLVLFQIALPLLAPLIDLFSLYALVFLGARWVAAYWACFLALQLALGWYAFRLDRESPWSLVAMPFQQFVYRQLMYLVVVESVLTALRGTHFRWRPSDRTGDVEIAG
jgi:cellulose synthase/poly-beta-1,6-N-acetylglucosamine synthase-like glycosyltransferase/peptidoglycan/xylan/chitin deacetylase (PgdA/CDA1 family)